MRVTADGWECAEDLAALPAGPYTIIYLRVGLIDRNQQLLGTLRRCYERLAPGGVLISATVNAAAVAAVLATATTFDDQAYLTSILDAERSHWTAELLVPYLTLTGFTNARQTTDLRLFSDVSQLEHGGKRIGLTVLADKPRS